MHIDILPVVPVHMYQAHISSTNSKTQGIIRFSTRISRVLKDKSGAVKIHIYLVYVYVVNVYLQQAQLNDFKSNLKTTLFYDDGIWKFTACFHNDSVNRRDVDEHKLDTIV